MEAEPSSSVPEIQRLRRGMNDLVGVLALSAVWTGGDESLVATTLLDALVRMMNLDFAYLWLGNSVRASSNEWARFGDRLNQGIRPHEVGEAFRPFLADVTEAASLRVANPLGEGMVSLAVFPLGFLDRIGQFAAVSPRPEFPTDLERLVLQVATNQAAIALQDRQNVHQLRLAAEELEEQLSERAEELTAANETLRREAAENKRSEKALRETEDRLRRMADSIPEVVWVTDLEPEERVVYTSPSFERVWGLPVEDLYRNPRLWMESIHPEDRARVAATLSQWIAGADVSCQDVEFRIVRPDGTVRWIHERGVLTLNDQGKPTRVSGISTDITDHLLAEEELRRNDFYLAEGQRIAHLGSWAFDPSGFFDHWSHELFRIYGLDPARRAPTLAEYLELIHPQDRESMARTIETMLTEASGCDIKKRIVRPDGEVRYIRCVGVPVVENGVLKRIVGTAMDVTEQEHLTQELRRREAYLAEAQRLSTTGSFRWRPSNGEILWSDETYRIFDVDRATKPTVELVLQATHPEDCDRVRQLIERMTREAKDWNLEHRLLMPDGTVKHLRVVARATHDESAGRSEYVGAVMDVTAATESRQALESAYGEIEGLKEQLQRENIVLREEIDKTSMFEEIVGVSAPLRSVLAQVSRVAPTDSTVLITGETGTGKELVARAIHKRSLRSARALVSVNCAAIPPSLIASELFGHEKGAFTGALQRRQGRFELADGGTMFLDEVGELPAETQIALLRVLQEREFERVGGGRPIRTDVRVIAASNRDLEAAVAQDAFRADLFYRLNVFPLQIPALRDRRADIPVLVEYFIHRYARRAGKRVHGISKASLDLLRSYDWPGNVRELQNVVERAVIVSDSEMLSIDERWLTGRPRTPHPPESEHPQTLATHERVAIEDTLAETRGRVAGPFGAAARLGIPSSTLESKIRALKIDKKRFKAAPPASPR